MLAKFQTLRTVALAAVLPTLFSACAVYKLDIQQGNVITEEMVEKLANGMDKIQVNSIVGTPLVVDPFRDNRWEYVYSMKKDDHVTQQFSYVTLVFNQEKLSDIQVHEKPVREKDLETLNKTTGDDR